jgi:hypothetical protein
LVRSIRVGVGVVLLRQTSANGGVGVTSLAGLVTFRPFSITLVADIEGERLQIVGGVELSIFLRYAMLHVRTACSQPRGCVALAMPGSRGASGDATSNHLHVVPGFDG